MVDWIEVGFFFGGVRIVRGPFECHHEILIGRDGCCNSNLRQVGDGMDSSTHRLWLDRDEVEVGLLNQWVEWT